MKKVFSTTNSSTISEDNYRYLKDEIERIVEISSDSEEKSMEQMNSILKLINFENYQYIAKKSIKGLITVLEANPKSNIVDFFMCTITKMKEIREEALRKAGYFSLTNNRAQSIECQVLKYFYLSDKETSEEILKHFYKLIKENYSGEIQQGAIFNLNKASELIPDDEKLICDEKFFDLISHVIKNIKICNLSDSEIKMSEISEGYASEVKNKKDKIISRNLEHISCILNFCVPKFSKISKKSKFDQYCLDCVEKIVEILKNKTEEAEPFINEPSHKKTLSSMNAWLKKVIEKMKNNIEANKNQVTYDEISTKEIVKIANGKAITTNNTSIKIFDFGFKNSRKATGRC